MLYNMKSSPFSIISRLLFLNSKIFFSISFVSAEILKLVLLTGAIPILEIIVSNGIPLATSISI